MNRIDLHPEELIDRRRRAVLTPDERARLDAHLAVCASCAAEEKLDALAALETAPRAGDEDLVARVVVGASETLGLGIGGKISHRPKRASRWTMLLVAAVVLLVASVGAARVWTLVTKRAPSPPTLANEETTSRARAVAPGASSGVSLAVPDQTNTGAGDDEATLRVDAPAVPNASSPLPDGPHSPPTAGARRRAPTSAIAQESGPSAASLFADANTARRRGDGADAVRAYRELARRFPGSDEEILSRVTLGRLLLDRMGDPAGALALFDSYLADPGRGTLREEATIGRALALGRLGRTREEKSAWQSLLRSYPDSMYSERARARLSELP